MNSGARCGLPKTLMAPRWERMSCPWYKALSHRKPAHRPIVITGADGKKVEIEATAVPLFASAEQLVGAAAIFWIG